MIDEFDHIKFLAETIAKSLHPQRIYLFGSFAEGRNTPSIMFCSAIPLYLSFLFLTFSAVFSGNKKRAAGAAREKRKAPFAATQTFWHITGNGKRRASVFTEIKTLPRNVLPIDLCRKYIVAQKREKNKYEADFS